MNLYVKIWNRFLIRSILAILENDYRLWCVLYIVPVDPSDVVIQCLY